jgi:hypothetical protein
VIEDWSVSRVADRVVEPGRDGSGSASA